jgi:hypothetical protein
MIGEILIYINECYRKKLVTYADCKHHYDAMSADSLQSEAAWLLGDAMKALPFQLIFLRCYALFDEMAERAGCWKGLSDKQRMRFVNATIDVKEEILRRVAPGAHDDVVRQIERTCKRVHKAGRFKKAVIPIRNSMRDFPGPFGPRRGVILVHPGVATMQ